ncbi:hypothetical protein MTsN3n11_22210 [Qipengyuania sp. MTN3-11]
MLIDRDAEVGDCLCGGFLSWKTSAQLRSLGCDPAALSAHAVRRLRMFAGARAAETELVAPAFGLSRHALDTTLRDMAVASGARLEIDRARSIAPGCINAERREWRSDAIFLATGKHDLRGIVRPRDADDAALGLRVRLPAASGAAERVGDAIELHLFSGGYAGIVVQENGSTNVCLALRKSLLREAGGDPWQLLERLAERNPDFAQRLEGADRTLPVDTIGAVPYGWIARDTAPGLYRLGDQAAVIPSLAGEGMSIALASAADAASAWREGRSAADFQRRFARRARAPVHVAGFVWNYAEGERAGQWLVRLAGLFPGLARVVMSLSRI